LRSCPVAVAVRAALAGAVSASPPWVAERRRRCNPRRPASPTDGRRRRRRRRGRGRGRPGCPDTDHASRRAVRVLCPPCGRPSNGRAAVCCPRVRCPTRPVRSGRPDGHVSGVRGVCIRAVGRLPNSGQAEEEMAVHGSTSVHGRPGRRFARPRLRRHTRRLVDQQSGPAGGCPAGWLGSTTESKYRQVLPQVRPGQVAGWRPDHRAEPEGGDYAPWSSWWGRGRAAQRRRIPSGGRGRVRPQRGRGARRALSTENGQRSNQRELWWARQGLNL
jgi:hypothetical protein